MRKKTSLTSAQISPVLWWMVEEVQGQARRSTPLRNPSPESLCGLSAPLAALFFPFFFLLFLDLFCIFSFRTDTGLGASGNLCAARALRCVPASLFRRSFSFHSAVPSFSAAPLDLTFPAVQGIASASAGNIFR